MWLTARHARQSLKFNHGIDSSAVPVSWLDCPREVVHLCLNVCFDFCCRRKPQIGGWIVVSYMIIIAQKCRQKLQSDTKKCLNKASCMTTAKTTVLNKRVALKQWNKSNTLDKHNAHDKACRATWRSQSKNPDFCF